MRWFGNDWWEEPLIFFISEADDDLFDKFMDAFFHADISKELDQKSQNLQQQPVVGVSWYDAKSYCLWLSLMAARESKLELKEATGLYRLPTEFEWEWAAAGRESDGSLREYPWPANKGEPSDKLANYDENVGASTPIGRCPDGTTPEGLMDMAGNVWEWMGNRPEEDGDWRALHGGRHMGQLRVQSAVFRAFLLQSRSSRQRLRRFSRCTCPVIITGLLKI